MRAVADGGMLHWLGRVCRDAREERDRSQVHIAAALDVNQATVARFERGQAWPRDPDLMVRAYANDLDITAVELWAEAVRRWRDDQP